MQEMHQDVGNNHCAKKWVIIKCKNCKKEVHHHHMQKTSFDNKEKIHSEIYNDHMQKKNKGLGDDHIQKPIKDVGCDHMQKVKKDVQKIPREIGNAVK